MFWRHCFSEFLRWYSGETKPQMRHVPLIHLSWDVWISVAQLCGVMSKLSYKSTSQYLSYVLQNIIQHNEWQHEPYSEENSWVNFAQNTLIIIITFSMSIFISNVYLIQHFIIQFCEPNIICNIQNLLWT